MSGPPTAPSSPATSPTSSRATPPPSPPAQSADSAFLSLFHPSSPAPPSSSAAPLPNNAPSSSVLATLAANPVFAGGLGLASLGVAAAFARRSAVRLADLARRQLLVSVEVSRQDPAYPWLLAWLTQASAETAGAGAGIVMGRGGRPDGWLMGLVARRLTRVRKLAATTTLASGAGGGGSSSGSSGGSSPAQAHFQLAHGYGTHVVRYGGAFMAVTREKQSTAAMATGEPHETLTLTLLYAQRGALEAVFRSAASLASRSRQGRTAVYSARGVDWTPLGQPRTRRPLESVVLDKGVKEALVADVEGFLKSKGWYTERGVPYRRGYLLHGPPGTGKSSFVLALAGHLDYAVATLNLAEHGLTDDRLAYLLTRMPPRTLLLLEDADAAFGNRRAGDASTESISSSPASSGRPSALPNASRPRSNPARDRDGYTGATVTFSGLLNALDGVAAGEERLCFLTTNHADRLDAALVRPGRVDVAVRIGEASRTQAAEMWDRFYGDVDGDGKGRQRFLSRMADLGLFGAGKAASTAAAVGAGGETRRVPKRHTSTAAIQGLFLFNKGDMEGAIAMVEGLLPRTFEAEEDYETEIVAESVLRTNVAAETGEATKEAK